jgi:hypothetical protein
VKGRSNSVVNIELETAAHRMLNLFHKSGEFCCTSRRHSNWCSLRAACYCTYLLRKDTFGSSDLRRMTEKLVNNELEKLKKKAAVAKLKALSEHV